MTGEGVRIEPRGTVREDEDLRASLERLGRVGDGSPIAKTFAESGHRLRNGQGRDVADQIGDRDGAFRTRHRRDPTRDERGHLRLAPDHHDGAHSGDPLGYARSLSHPNRRGQGGRDHGGPSKTQ